jgi:hypothetical protein
MIERFNICKEIRLKLDKEHWLDNESKLVEIINVGNVNIWNQKM